MNTLQQQTGRESDSEYLSKKPAIKQAIIDGLHTPLSECSETLDCPGWHGEILVNKEQAIANGSDEFEEWESAKAALRSLSRNLNGPSV